MSPEGTERRLAAILFTDLVGLTALMPRARRPDSGPEAIVETTTCTAVSATTSWAAPPATTSATEVRAIIRLRVIVFSPSARFFVATACPAVVRFPQCNDGVDNDGDGETDSDDPDCTSASDDNETPE